jgi:hypothetical protein
LTETRIWLCAFPFLERGLLGQLTANWKQGKNNFVKSQPHFVVERWEKLKDVLFNSKTENSSLNGIGPIFACNNLRFCTYRVLGKCPAKL